MSENSNAALPMEADKRAPERPRSRLRVAPGRLIGLLLAVEMFLFLSNQFQWFAFNEHKGWTVLLTAACFGVVGVVLVLWFQGSLLCGLRFQFSLRALLLLTVAFAIPCGWFSVARNQALRQSEIKQSLQGDFDTLIDLITTGPPNHRYVISEPDFPDRGQETPQWLRKLLGEDFFVELLNLHIYFTKEKFDWAGLMECHQLRKLRLGGQVPFEMRLENLAGLTQLQSLELQDESQVDDAQLAQLSGLTQLKVLDLRYTRVTGKGLGALRRMQHLRKLSLCGVPLGDDLSVLRELRQLQTLVLDFTDVSDAGLATLADLTHLEQLYLNFTNLRGTGFISLRGLKELRILSLNRAEVNDAGLANLEPLTQLQTLVLGSTRIEDAGMAHLQNMQELIVLDLSDTKVGDAGIVYLRDLKRLQHLLLYGTMISDEGLQILGNLPELSELNVRGTNVTREGVEQLGIRLPLCHIEAD